VIFPSEEEEATNELSEGRLWTRAVQGQAVEDVALEMEKAK